MSDFKDNVKVAIRIRPLNEKEQSENSLKALSVLESKTILLDSKPEPRSFKYDNVSGEEVSQEDFFETVGKPITTSCLSGYNGTIFAYGQTGAGKTFTIQGAGFEEYSANLKCNYHLRGILPRCFEYLFSCVAEEVKKRKAEYLIKCSYLEIYQENINDLLAETPRNLQLREDMKKGVYVEGLIEETVRNTMETYELLNLGAQNRHVSYTSMNKESSRSHSVFTLIIESKASVEGLVNFKTSRFHLIDLAGSERQKATDCAGDRLKEAGMINKSLSALGNVINSLVDISEGKSRHVHYRDSKLTFLLKDSLGGNSKTFIVANVSPAVSAFAETLSTLKFAQRAKMIKNAAVINEDVTGTVNLLRYEIKKLRDELSLQKSISSEAPSTCPSCSSMMSKNFELSNLVDNIKDLEYLLEKNTRLRISSERQLESLVVEKEKQIKSLKSAADKLESKAKHDKMVLKFRDATIARLQGGPESDEIDSLRKENASLKEQVEKNPMAAQLFVENERLKAECESLKKECKFDSESLNGRIREGHEFTEKLCDTLNEYAVEKEKIMKLIDEQGRDNEVFRDEIEKSRKIGDEKVRLLETEKEALISRVRGLLKINEDRAQGLEEEENLIKSAEKIEEFFKKSEKKEFFDVQVNEMKASAEGYTAKAAEDAVKIKELEEKLAQTQQELTFYIDKSEEKENQLNQALQDIENLNDSSEYQKSNIERLNKAIFEKSEIVEECKSTIKRLEQQLNEVMTSLNVSEECETLTRKIEELEKNKEKMQKINGELKNELKKVQSLYETSQLQEQAEKKAVSKLYKKLSNAINELEVIKERENEMNEKIDILEDEKAKNIELSAKIEEEVCKASEIAQRCEKAENQNIKFANEIISMREVLGRLETELLEKSNCLKEAWQAIEDYKSELNTNNIEMAQLKETIEVLQKNKLEMINVREFIEQKNIELFEDLTIVKESLENKSAVVLQLTTELESQKSNFESLLLELKTKNCKYKAKNSQLLSDLSSSVELEKKLQARLSKTKERTKIIQSALSDKMDSEVKSLLAENESLKAIVTNSSLKIDSLILELSDQKSKNQDLLTSAASLTKNHYEESEKLISAIKLEKLELEKQITELISEKNDLQGLIFSNSAIIQSLHQKILEEEKNSEQMSSSKNEMASSLHERTQIINSLELKLQELSEDREELLRINYSLDMSCKQNEEYIRDLQNSLENERSSNEDNIIKRFEIEKAVNDYESEIELLRVKCSSEIEKNEELYTKLESAQLEIKQYEAENENIFELLKSLRLPLLDLSADNQIETQQNLQENIARSLKLLKLNLETVVEEGIKAKDHVIQQICDGLDMEASQSENVIQQVSAIKAQNEELKTALMNSQETLTMEKKRNEILNKESEMFRNKINKLSSESNREINRLKEEIAQLEAKVSLASEMTSKLGVLQQASQELSQRHLELASKNEDFSKENEKLKQKVFELSELKEKALEDLLQAQQEIDSLKEENKSKMDILKNTNKNILSTRNEINMWKKCIDDKNLLIQELRNELKRKDEDFFKFQSEVKHKQKSWKESPDKEEGSEVRYLTQVLQMKEKELRELKEKGQEYYSQADEALESQRKEIEIFTKRCTSLQGEVKRLKDELRASLKDRETMIEEIKKLKNDEYKSFRDNEDVRKMLNQLREEKNKLLMELTRDNDTGHQGRAQDRLKQENNVLKAQVEKLSQDLHVLIKQNEGLALKVKDSKETGLKVELERQSEQINSLTECLARITDFVFSLPQVSIHPEETSIVDSTIKAIKGLADQLSIKDSHILKPYDDKPPAKGASAFKSQLAQYYALVNKAPKSPTSQRYKSAFK